LQAFHCGRNTSTVGSEKMPPNRSNFFKDNFDLIKKKFIVNFKIYHRNTTGSSPKKKLKFFDALIPLINLKVDFVYSRDIHLTKNYSCP